MFVKKHGIDRRPLLNNSPPTASVSQDVELFFFVSSISTLNQMTHLDTIRSLIYGTWMLVRHSILRILRNHVVEPSLKWSTVHQYNLSIDRLNVISFRSPTLGQNSLIFSLGLNCTSMFTTYGLPMAFVGHLSTLVLSYLLHF